MPGAMFNGQELAEGAEMSPILPTIVIFHWTSQIYFGVSTTGTAWETTELPGR